MKIMENKLFRKIKKNLGRIIHAKIRMKFG